MFRENSQTVIAIKTVFMTSRGEGGGGGGGGVSNVDFISIKNFQRVGFTLGQRLYRRTRRLIAK